MVKSTLGRAAVIVSGGVLLSRLLGLARQALLAGLLGRGTEADLYKFAFTIPDYLFFLMAGGYLTITLVPILARHIAAEDDRSVNESFTAVFRFVGLLMGAATALTMLAAPRVVPAVFSQVPDTRIDELVDLVRIVLPAQFFFVMGSLLMAYQYAHRRFLIPTLAPLIYNLGIIAGGAIGYGVAASGPIGFIWGALAGAIVGNFGVQWVGARRLGLRLVRGPRMFNSAVREYLVLALPLMLGQSAVALDEVFIGYFGQFADAGGTAGLEYARRLNMVPVGIIAQAAGVASFPFLAGLFAEGRLSEMRETVRTALRASLTVAGLGAAGTIGLALAISQIALQRGAFDLADSRAVASLLAVYGLSIPLWAAHQVYTRALYAERRMWAPVVIGTATTVAAIPAYFLAARDQGAIGIAIVSVVTMVVYTLAIAWWWHRDTESAGPILATTARSIAASVPAGMVAYGISRALAPESAARALVALGLGGIAAVAVYVAIIHLLRGPEIVWLSPGRLRQSR